MKSYFWMESALEKFEIWWPVDRERAQTWIKLFILHHWIHVRYETAAVKHAALHFGSPVDICVLEFNTHINVVKKSFKYKVCLTEIQLCKQKAKCIITIQQDWSFNLMQ